MSNEVVNLKLYGNDGESTKPVQTETPEIEYTEGSYRYNALTDADVNSLNSAARPTLITLFGISECGKTTFVGSLFAILRRRPDLLKKTFLDSDTLTGFEKRVHLRLLSESGVSVQQRTRRKANSILNAVLGNERGENSHMFVFSDKSGEIYLDAVSKDNVVEEQTAVKYADRLVLFVDIEALLDDKKYMLYKKNTGTLLTRFKSKNMLPLNAEIFVAFNKIDIVERAALEAAKTLKGEIDEAKKKEFINSWKSRRKSVLNVIKEIINVPDEQVFDICSKGIRRDAEDKGLIELLSKILDKPKMKSLSSEYNWIQGLLKS